MHTNKLTGCNTQCAKPRAILTAEKAVEIFRRSPQCDGMFTATSVGREYGVSEKAVRDIWSARTWCDETRHLDPLRPHRESKLPGRPLGKRDSAPRRRKLSNSDFPAEMKCKGPTKSSTFSHGSLQQMTGAIDGDSPAQHQDIQSSSFFGCPGLRIEQYGMDNQSGGVEDGSFADFQLIAISASSSQNNMRSLPSTDLCPGVLDFSLPFKMGCRSRASATADIAERAHSDGSSGGNGGGNGVGESDVQQIGGLAEPGGASSKSNSRGHNSSVGFGWSDAFSEEDGWDGADNWSRAGMGRCQSLRTAVTPTTYDKASCDRIKRYQPSAVSAHFAPNTNNGCDQVPPIAVAEQSERWAYNSQAAHAADGDRRGWASDFNLGWPERPAGDQEPCPARAPPYAAVSSRADRAYMAGAYTEKIQQDPPQGCLWSATPRGGAGSTWQLEPEHWTPVFDPPPKRSTAGETQSPHESLEHGVKMKQQELRYPPQQHSHHDPEHHQIHLGIHHQYHNHHSSYHHHHQHRQQYHMQDHNHQSHHQHPRCPPDVGHQHRRMQQAQQQQQPARLDPQTYQLLQYAMLQEQHQHQHFQYLAQQPSQQYDPTLRNWGQGQPGQDQPRHPCNWQGQQQDSSHHPEIYDRA